MRPDPQKSQIEVWVAKAQKGDEKSFSLLFDAYFERIYRYVGFRVEAHECEDLVGDVFLKLVQNLPKYESQVGVGFGAWIYRIAHNSVIDHYRRKKDMVGSEDEATENFFLNLPDETNLKPDEVTNNELDYQWLYKALKKVKPLHREILELKFLEGFSNKEIAKITGKTEGNIRILQLRALREIRKHLKES